MKKFSTVIAFRTTDEEKQALKKMGYTTRQLNGNKEVSLSMDKVWVHTMPTNPGCRPQHMHYCPNDPCCPGHPYNPCN